MNWQETTQVTRGKANPSPTAGSTQSPTSSASALLLGDGGEISSSSGEVLGDETMSDEESVATGSSTLASGKKNIIAYSAIGGGITILAGVGGWYGWNIWKKKRSL